MGLLGMHVLGGLGNAAVLPWLQLHVLFRLMLKNSALHALPFVPILQGHADVLQLLLQRGCVPDVNIADKCGSTALHTAAAGGHLAAVQLLLQAGAAVDARATANATALHCAAAAGLVMCPDAAAVVKDRIRSQDIRSSSSSSSLAQQQQQQRECGRWPGLLGDFRSYSSSTSSRCSSVSDLSCAAAAASAVVAALLAAGASTAAADSAGWLPLHWAVARGCSRTVRHLLQHEHQDAHSSSSSSSSSVNALTTAEGWSPLHLAVMLRRGSVVQQLLQHPGCQVSLESCYLQRSYSGAFTADDVASTFFWTQQCVGCKCGKTYAGPQFAALSAAVAGMVKSARTLTTLTPQDTCYQHILLESCHATHSSHSINVFALFYLLLVCRRTWQMRQA
jgi:hypothetical protein